MPADFVTTIGECGADVYGMVFLDNLENARADASFL